MYLPAMECVRTGSQFSVIFLVFYILCQLTWRFTDFYILKLLIDFCVCKSYPKIPLCNSFGGFFFFSSEPGHFSTKGKNGLLLLEILGKEYLGKACINEDPGIYLKLWKLSNWTLQALGVLITFRHFLSHQPALLPNLMKYIIILTELKGFKL